MSRRPPISCCADRDYEAVWKAHKTIAKLGSRETVELVEPDSRRTDSARTSVEAQSAFGPALRDDDAGPTCSPARQKFALATLTQKYACSKSDAKDQRAVQWLWRSPIGRMPIISRASVMVAHNDGELVAAPSVVRRCRWCGISARIVPDRERVVRTSVLHWTGSHKAVDRQHATAMRDGQVASRRRLRHPPRLTKPALSGLPTLPITTQSPMPTYQISFIVG